MSLAALARFGPLLSIVNLPMGKITDAQLATAVSALSGGPNDEMLTLFRRVRDENGEVLVQDALNSPLVKKAFNQFTEAAENQSMLVCECPHCGSFFEPTLRNVP